MLVVSWLIISTMGFIINNHMFAKLIDKKIKINSKFIVCLLILGMISYIKVVVDFGQISPYIIHICLFVALKYLYKKDFVTTIIGILGILFLVFISELCVGLILILLKINLNTLATDPVYSILLNSLIYFISLMLFNIKFIYNSLKKIIKWYKNNSYRNTAILFLLALSILVFSSYNNFVEILPSSLLLATNIFCIGVFVFIIGYFIEKSNNNQLKEEYKQLLNYTGTYEKLLDDKNKKQHEYKNQLILLSDMVKSKKAKQYISDLLDTQTEEIEYSWINKLKNLPNGGIKGLIYYKIQRMLDLKIDVFVDISNELNNKKLWKRCNDNLKDISMILGVFIDNAIEATLQNDKKSIIIEGYIEDKNIVYSISNTYKEINLKKIEKEKYTTKGKGRGYGLTLVKDIVNENELLEVKKEINGNYYISRLYISNKKTRK